MFSPSTTIREISEHHPLFEAVLDRYSLRFSEQGMPIGVACEEQEIETEFFIEILLAFEAPMSFNATAMKRFPVPVVLDYLYRTHAYYQEKRLGEIEQSVARLADVYGTAHPLLALLRAFFQRYRLQLSAHIEDEEQNLFPYAMKVWEASQEGKLLDEAFSTEDFLYAHGEDELDVPLREIQQLVERRHPEVKRLFPYNVLNWQLNALQQDLWLHERVEEDVLIPQLESLKKQ